MKRVFKYRFSRRTLLLSALYLAVLALIGAGLHRLYIGGYLSAWFLSLVGALVALMALSIPRKIVVKPATVEILCLLDMTEIPRIEIASAGRVEPRQMRWVVPLLGSYGFFGYYGYYFDLKSFEKVIVYASEWKNLVEIVDIYEPARRTRRESLRCGGSRRKEPSAACADDLVHDDSRYAAVGIGYR